MPGVDCVDHPKRLACPSPRFTVPEDIRAGALIKSREEYQRMYDRSMADPGFWGELGREYIDWIVPFERANDEDFSAGRIEWFPGGKLNVAVNCLDRHLVTRGDKVAILWEGDEPGENRSVTYRQLYEESCQLANELKARGIKRGDRVAIYMGMVPELAAAMLACARIGVIHSVIFGGFSPGRSGTGWRLDLPGDYHRTRAAAGACGAAEAERRRGAAAAGAHGGVHARLPRSENACR
jgi:acetyl-CoA synthetase